MPSPSLDGRYPRAASRGVLEQTASVTLSPSRFASRPSGSCKSTHHFENRTRSLSREAVPVHAYLSVEGSGRAARMCLTISADNCGAAERPSQAMTFPEPTTFPVRLSIILYTQAKVRNGRVTSM